MFIEDYGLTVELVGDEDNFWLLESGIPQGKTYQEKVKIIYNGQMFAKLSENNDHISCWVNNIGTLTIDKGRWYQEHGRDATILSHILYAYEIRGYNKNLQRKLREIIDANFTYLFSETRNEEDV